MTCSMMQPAIRTLGDPDVIRILLELRAGPAEWHDLLKRSGITDPHRGASAVLTLEDAGAVIQSYAGPCIVQLTEGGWRAADAMADALAAAAEQAMERFRRTIKRAEGMVQGKDDPAEGRAVRVHDMGAAYRPCRPPVLSERSYTSTPSNRFLQGLHSVQIGFANRTVGAGGCPSSPGSGYAIPEMRVCKTRNQGVQNSECLLATVHRSPASCRSRR